MQRVCVYVYIWLLPFKRLNIKFQLTFQLSETFLAINHDIICKLKILCAASERQKNTDCESYVLLAIFSYLLHGVVVHCMCFSRIHRMQPTRQSEHCGLRVCVARCQRIKRRNVENVKNRKKTWFETLEMLDISLFSRYILCLRFVKSLKILHLTVLTTTHTHTIEIVVRLWNIKQASAHSFSSLNCSCLGCAFGLKISNNSEETCGCFEGLKLHYAYIVNENLSQSVFYLMLYDECITLILLNPLLPLQFSYLD